MYILQQERRKVDWWKICLTEKVHLKMSSLKIFKFQLKNVSVSCSKYLEESLSFSVTSKRHQCITSSIHCFSFSHPNLRLQLMTISNQYKSSTNITWSRYSSYYPAIANRFSLIVRSDTANYSQYLKNRTKFWFEM